MYSYDTSICVSEREFNFGCGQGTDRGGSERRTAGFEGTAGATTTRGTKRRREAKPTKQSGYDISIDVRGHVGNESETKQNSSAAERPRQRLAVLVVLRFHVEIGEANSKRIRRLSNCYERSGNKTNEHYVFWVCLLLQLTCSSGSLFCCQVDSRKYRSTGNVVRGFPTAPECC